MPDNKKHSQEWVGNRASFGSNDYLPIVRDPDGTPDNKYIKVVGGKTEAPDADNDGTEGYNVGSRWIDTTNDKEYVCLDNSTGAAVWTETTAGAAGGISNVVEDTTPQLGGNLDANGNTITDLDASTSAKGIVELATAAETTTGTDTGRAVTPVGLRDSIRNLRFVDFILVDAAVDCSTGTDLIEWECPFDATIIQDDSNKNYFSAWNATAGSTGTMVVDVHLNGTTIMTTNKLDIETGEASTDTATTQPDLTTTDIAPGDLITIDVDSVHSGTAAKGLTVRIALRPD